MQVLIGVACSITYSICIHGKSYDPSIKINKNL